MKKIILIAICTGVLFPCTNFSLDFLQQVELNNIVKVREMVNQGADVNQSDKLGFTALHISSWNGYIELTKYLLDLGANPNVTSPSGYTPLAFANPAIKDLLIRYGAYASLGPPPPTLIIREPVVISNTPSINIVKPPVEIPQRAVVPIVSNFITNIVQNNTVLYPKTSYSILKNISPDESTLLHRWDRNGINDLHRAAKEGSYQEVTNLVAKGINPLGTDNNGYNALMYAIKSGNLAAVKFLVDQGIDVYASVSGGAAAIAFARKQNSEEIISYLQSLGLTDTPQPTTNEANETDTTDMDEESTETTPLLLEDEIDF